MKLLHAKKIRRAFTLVEVMIVIVILGRLAAVAYPQIFGKLDKGKVGVAMTQIKSIEAAVNDFYLDTNRLPNTLDELLSSTEKGWSGPYLANVEELPKDPWGHAYTYKKINEKEFEIISLGADGQVGGEGVNADLSNRRKAEPK